MITRRLILCFVLILANPAVSFASDVYFPKDSIAPTLISPPFADKSPEQKKELEYIIKLQQNPDAAEVAKAGNERNLSPEVFLDSVMPYLKRDKFPATYALLDKVSKTSYGVNDTAKNYWKTDRPYIVDKRVKSLIEAHKNPSYPSGHTSGSYVLAHVMSMLIPEHSKEFYTKAESIAQHRVLVGMHFPHDLEGGKQLAFLIVGGLLQNKQFLEDLDKSRQELKDHPVTLQ